MKVAHALLDEFAALKELVDASTESPEGLELTMRMDTFFDNLAEYICEKEGIPA